MTQVQVRVSYHLFKERYSQLRIPIFNCSISLLPQIGT